MRYLLRGYEPRRRVLYRYQTNIFSQFWANLDLGKLILNYTFNFIYHRSPDLLILKNSLSLMTSFQWTDKTINSWLNIYFLEGKKERERVQIVYLYNWHESKQIIPNTEGESTVQKRPSPSNLSVKASPCELPE